MTEFTLADLRRILEETSGVAEDADWQSADIEDTPFEDLGYDSLALLEMCAKVQNEQQVPIPDDAIIDMKTPRAALSYLNRRLSEVLGGES
jgi:minimal PKS acyl carrier protein